MTQPTYTHLRIFSCLCYPYLRPYNHNKLDSMSLPCVFLGFTTQYKGFWCLESNTKYVYISTHVKFNESVFPCLKPSSISLSQTRTEASFGSQIKDMSTMLVPGIQSIPRQSDDANVSDTFSPAPILSSSTYTPPCNVSSPNAHVPNVPSLLPLALCITLAFRHLLNHFPILNQGQFHLLIVLLYTLPLVLLIQSVPYLLLLFKPLIPMGFHLFIDTYSFYHNFF